MKQTQSNVMYFPFKANLRKFRKKAIEMNGSQFGQQSIINGNDHRTAQQQAATFNKRGTQSLFVFMSAAVRALPFAITCVDHSGPVGNVNNPPGTLSPNPKAKRPSHSQEK